MEPFLQTTNNQFHDQQQNNVYNKQQTEEDDVPTYSEAFPPLADLSDAPSSANKPAWGASRSASSSKSGQSQRKQNLSIAPSRKTQNLHIPLEERRFINKLTSPSEVSSSEERGICRKIMDETGVNIEICGSKDGGLTLSVAGRQGQIDRARVLVNQRLQMQANIGIPIPKEHHKFILGKKGERLSNIQKATGTKITVPPSNNDSDEIRIFGTKEGIDQATAEIQEISDEMSKRAFERVTIPKCYHPFIRGARDSIINKYAALDTRINVPPSMVESDELTIQGEKTGVAMALDEITKIYNELLRTCKTIPLVVPRKQHKYLRGPRGDTLHEILEKANVSVELPAADDASDTIVLRGPSKRLGNAVDLVFEKANSVEEALIQCPSWLHPRLIGKQGQDIRQINDKFPEVHVSFTKNDNIELEGPPKLLEEVKEILEGRARALKNSLTFEILKVNPTYVKHIIGRNGVNINRLRSEHDVSLRMEEGDDTIRIEGKKESVQFAVKELKEIIKKMETEVTKDINIEHRLHRLIIGSGGEKIREIRVKYPDVNISFPTQQSKSPVVSLRGPKDQIEQCVKFLETLVKEIAELNFMVQVPLFRDFAKNIIGKGGANIKHIRDETDTKIDLPSNAEQSSKITITGRKEDVEKAKKMIQDIQSKLANMTVVKIDLPHKIHNQLIGPRGSTIRSIMQEFDVQIRFPDADKKEDEVVIRGSKEAVDKAKSNLLKLAEEKELLSYTEELIVKPELHRYIIGQSGKNISRIRQQYNVQVAIPYDGAEPDEPIVILGRQENVKKARADIEELVKEMANVVEDKIAVPKKFQKIFTSRSILSRELEERGNGVSMKVLKGQSAEEVTILLKGTKEYVEEAKLVIEDIIARMETFVTIEVSIPGDAQGAVVGHQGRNVNNLCRDFSVEIKFPDRRGARGRASRNAAPVEKEELTNGNTPADDASSEKSEASNVAPAANSIVLVTGTPDSVEQAKEALLSLVPVTEEVNIPFKYHRFMIGKGGKSLRVFQDKHDVMVKIPKMDAGDDMIKIEGLKKNVEEARKDMLEQVKDMELKAFTREIHVDPSFHSTIIGYSGSKINNLRKKYDVVIQMPKSENSEENSDVITLEGYEDKVSAAADEIFELVKEVESHVTYEVDLDRRVHPRVIGSKGRGVKNLMDKYSVDIRFPKGNENEPEAQNKVYVKGREDNVLKCVDELNGIEDEFMETVNDSPHLKQYMAPNRGGRENGGPPRRGGGGGQGRRGGARGGGSGGQQQHHNAGFTVKGAPWQGEAPNPASEVDFPTFANTAGGSA